MKKKKRKKLSFLASVSSFGVVSSLGSSVTYVSFKLRWWWRAVTRTMGRASQAAREREGAERRRRPKRKKSNATQETEVKYLTEKTKKRKETDGRGDSTGLFCPSCARVPISPSPLYVSRWVCVGVCVWVYVGEVRACPSMPF